MLFIYERKVNYYETDQMGIVHHSNYIRWLEEARIAWMESLDFPYQILEENGILIPVLGVSCKYVDMVRFGETVKIELEIVKYTPTRFDVEYTIYHGNNTPCTTGSSNHCFINRAGRPVSLKKLLPEAHEVFSKNSRI